MGPVENAVRFYFWCCVSSHLSARFHALSSFDRGTDVFGVTANDLRKVGYFG